MKIKFEFSNLLMFQKRWARLVLIICTLPNSLNLHSFHGRNSLSWVEIEFIMEQENNAIFGRFIKMKQFWVKYAIFYQIRAGRLM